MCICDKEFGGEFVMVGGVVIDVEEVVIYVVVIGDSGGGFEGWW